MRGGGFTLPQQRDPESVRGFTLAELVVSTGVLVLLVLLFMQLLNSAATVTILGHKRMDADSQSRQLLDRMAIDFAQMVKRPDVDYYLKSSSGAASDCGVCGVHDQDGWTGNDQAAFYSMVPGYYSIPTPTPVGSPIAASPVSLISYRINSDNASSSYNKLERMGKSLAWNGVSNSTPPNSSLTPLVFLPQTIGGPNPPGPSAGYWPSAVSSSATDSSYEVIGPQVFRFEYYYLLKGQTAQVGAPTPTPTANPTIFSDTPWDTRISGNTNVVRIINGVVSSDVSAIIVDIATIDPKSKVLLSDDQVAQVGSQLIDWGDASCGGCPSPTQWQTTPGLLRAQWQSTLDGITNLPRSAISGIRVYERYFYLNQ
jgi:hypothetical protein